MWASKMTGMEEKVWGHLVDGRRMATVSGSSWDGQNETVRSPSDSVAMLII